MGIKNKLSTVYLRLASLCIALIIAGSALGQAPEENYIFENLGKPVYTAMDIDVVTQDEKMGAMAWGGVTDGDRSGLVGVRVEDGKSVYVDLLPFGKANSVLVFKGSERYLYLYAGVHGRFFKYDIHENRLDTLGKKSRATYWMGTSFSQGPDGRIYVGTYPRAAVSILDPSSDQVQVLDRISASAGSQYVINPASSDDGIVYLPTGMHHGELWSYDPESGKKTQILPKAMQTYGPPTVWKAADGKVYGRKGSTHFLCTPTGIVKGDSQPKVTDWSDKTLGDRIVQGIDRKGYLVLQDRAGNKVNSIKTDFDLPAEEVFSVGAVRENKLYGSSLKPGHVFTYDLGNGSLEDLGKITRGGVQVYDMLAYGNGLFASSYTGGYIDYFQADAQGNLKRQSVARLHSLAKQERAVQLVLGPDNKIYTPTTPIKGYLGGALVQIDPDNMHTKVFKPLPKQSLTSVTPVPETGMLFITASVSGGSSSKPVLKEAEVLLWNPKTEKIAYRGKPIAGARRYGKAVLADDGIIYGSYRDSLYGFDPVRQEVVYKVQVPGRKKTSSQNVRVSETLGTGGLVYMVDNVSGNVLSLNPETKALRILAHHATLIGTRFAEAKQDGYLYYGHDSELWRVRLSGALESE